MAHLADLIVRRGGTAEEAMVYQNEFQRRLGLLVDGRLEDVRGGRRAGDSLLVTGVRELFEMLRARGIAMTLASGTPLPQLRAEAELLDVAHYFEGRIFGPTGTDDSAFAKRNIIAGLLENGSLEPAALLAFGDGPVELSETKAHGGLAVAVASDEVEPGSGRVEAWKREMLLAAGADVVIADFREPGALLNALMGR
jgi:phosphoglycolate phosphatase-like HAD superfamily hydrolase